MKYYSVIKGMNILATWVNLKTCSGKKQSKIITVQFHFYKTIGMANIANLF